MKTLLPTVQHLGCHVVELHYSRPLFETMTHISSSADAYQLLMDFVNPYRIDLKEFFFVILLSGANRVLCTAEVASGSTKCVSINIKEILQLSLFTNASAIIVAHNHPSGTLKPSSSDSRFTDTIKKASELLDITLLDHLIFTSEGYYSFSDSGLL